MSSSHVLHGVVGWMFSSIGKGDEVVGIIILVWTNNMCHVGRKCWGSSIVYLVHVERGSKVPYVIRLGRSCCMTTWTSTRGVYSELSFEWNETCLRVDIVSTNIKEAGENRDRRSGIGFHCPKKEIRGRKEDKASSQEREGFTGTP